MLFYGLLLVTVLVLGGGAKAVDNGSTDVAIFSIVIAPCQCGCFGAKRSNTGAAISYLVTFMVRMDDAGRPYLIQGDSRVDSS